MAQIKTVSITDLTSYEESGIKVPDSLKIFCNITTDSECSCCNSSSGLSWIELFNKSSVDGEAFTNEQIELIFKDNQFVLHETIVDHEERIIVHEERIIDHEGRITALENGTVIVPDEDDSSPEDGGTASDSDITALWEYIEKLEEKITTLEDRIDNLDVEKVEELVASVSDSYDTLITADDDTDTRFVIVWDNENSESTDNT